MGVKDRMGRTALIVDDAAFMRTMLKNILIKHGFDTIEEAANGSKAIEKYKECKPDIVTMDITMPEMDGIKSVKGIKKIDANAKIIICSGMGRRGIVIDAIEAGACEYIIKPFKEDLVMQKINKVLGG